MELQISLRPSRPSADFVHEVEIPVRELEPAITLFTEVLGFTLVGPRRVISRWSRAAVELVQDDIVLILSELPELPAPISGWADELALAESF